MNLLRFVYVFIVTMKFFEYLENENGERENEACKIKVYPLLLRLKN